MRGMGRVFASAVVRRLGYALGSLLLMAMMAFCGKAQAQAAACGANPVSCDEGQAYQAAVSLADSSGSNICQLIGTPTTTYTGARVTKAGSDSFQAGITCSNGGVASGGNTYFRNGQTCASRANVTHAGYTFVAGSTQCLSGCETNWAPNEGGGSTGITSGGTCDKGSWTCPEGSDGSAVLVGSNDSEACEPAAPECPEGEEKVDGVCKHKETCPAGQHTNSKGECENDKDTCPAGQTKGPDGSCLDNACGSGMAKGKDGTCKIDADGDGVADSEQGDDAENDDGTQFSGGDNCDAPPSCSGDVIACGMARIQWRIECNTRKDTKVAGGACDAMPICTGKNCDAVEYAQLIQVWKGTCALEKLGIEPGTGGDDDEEMVSSGGVTGGDDQPGGGAGAVREIGEDGGITFDESGFGYSRSCPTIPPIDVMGKPLVFDTSVACDWIAWGGVLIMIGAYLAGLYILFRG